MLASGSCLLRNYYFISMLSNCIAVKDQGKSDAVKLKVKPYFYDSQEPFDHDPS